MKLRYLKDLLILYYGGLCVLTAGWCVYLTVTADDGTWSWVSPVLFAVLTGFNIALAEVAIKKRIRVLKKRKRKLRRREEEKSHDQDTGI